MPNDGVSLDDGSMDRGSADHVPLKDKSLHDGLLQDRPPSERAANATTGSAPATDVPVQYVAGAAPLAPAADKPIASRLDISHLHKRYGTRVVVKDVSLSVEAGGVVGFLGPNGGGKATCFFIDVGPGAGDGGRLPAGGRPNRALAA